MDLQTFITIIIVLGLIVTAYSLKLQIKGEMIIFGDFFDIVISLGIVLFPVISFAINQDNTALMFWLAVIPLVMSLKISFTNNSGNFYYSILSFISKLTAVATVALIFLLLIFRGASRENQQDKK